MKIVIGTLTLVALLAPLLSPAGQAQAQVPPLRLSCTIHAGGKIGPGDEIEFPRTIAEFTVVMPYKEKKELYRDETGFFELVYVDSMHVIGEDGSVKFHKQLIVKFTNLRTGDSSMAAFGFRQLPEGFYLDTDAADRSLLCNRLKKGA